ncbi:MAG: 6-phosphogluconolactonase [Nitrospirae bacterium]|nr:MAG: 6-phosphogluconolactonase [Nitrospirota bacterium]
MESTLREEVRIFPDPEGLARAAAAIFAGSAERAIAGKGRFSVALSGGSTPLGLFRILGSAYGDTLRWEQVHLFWADERSVPPDHEESNFRHAHEELLSKVLIPASNIHRIRGELPPLEAAAGYAREMVSYFGTAGPPAFDCILLGLGQDGHTASLFPGSDGLKDTGHYALPSYSGAAGNWRVTLTLAVLNNAAEILFLVSGAAKAGIVREVLQKGQRDLYPAGSIRPSRGSITWLLDREAASGLGAC